MRKMFFTGLVVLCSYTTIQAQETRKDKMLKDRKEFSDRTLFQQFEFKLVPTAEERKQKQFQNNARREMLLTIIDTTQIKEQLKLKLKHDVVHNPFSNRLKKFMEEHELQEKMNLTD